MSKSSATKQREQAQQRAAHRRRMVAAGRRARRPVFEAVDPAPAKPIPTITREMISAQVQRVRERRAAKAWVLRVLAGDLKHLTVSVKALLLLLLACASSMAADVDLTKTVELTWHTAGPYAYVVSPESGPLLTAEWLTPEVLAGPGAKRGSFRIDRSLPSALQQSALPFAGGLFDQGHLAAFENYGDPEHAWATMLVSNMVPTVPKVNRGVMAQVEKRIRALVDERHNALVLTLVDRHPTDQLLPGSKHRIPSAIDKAVLVYLDGQPERAVCWRVPNGAGPVQPISVPQLEHDHQLDLFAHLPDDIEQQLEARMPELK